MNTITKDMVADGYKQGLIRLATLEYAAGIVCVIGDNWFYFGGTTAEEMTVEEYKKAIPEDTIISEIYETLEDFKDDFDTFDDEYMYYYYYLLETLKK